jgi:RNA polymerase sigma-70 factor (ECF subfamily)
VVSLPALVNGAAGVVGLWRGRPFSVMGFTVVRGRIVEIDVVLEPARLRAIDLSAFSSESVDL